MTTPDLITAAGVIGAYLIGLLIGWAAARDLNTRGQDNTPTVPLEPLTGCSCGMPDYAPWTHSRLVCEPR